MQDDELIAAIRRGDDTALRALYERHARWLAARLRRGLPADAVEDVLQETFIAVWRGAGTYRGRGEAGAWLWGIARRQAASWARKHGRAVPFAPLDARPETVSGDDPAATVTRRLDLGAAFRALGAEGDGLREIARLIFVEERSIADAARELDIPEGTVKSRVHRARRRLRETLRRGGY